MTLTRLLPYFLIAIILAPIQTLSAQDNLLGEINFPNSGADAAQADFMEGMLFLHNFEYEDAARAFRRAQEIDPGFAMAYYGEAKSHNHPLWMRQYRKKAMEVLEQLGGSYEERQQKAATQREKDLLHSLEVLYGNTPETKGLPKEERDDRYRDEMKRLHENYPSDHEVTAFYGLSILGSAHEGRNYATYMKAAAVLFEVWNENPKHPGAAHYLIHSFDDPIHAPLGLPMAQTYSEIAPAAAHAQHMTSHIFLALGLWQETIEANIVARDVQNNREQELGEEPTVCGHYPWWLQYGYLQKGAPEDASTVLQACTERVTKGAKPRELWHFAMMRGHQVIETDRDGSERMAAEAFTPETSGARNYYFASGYSAWRSDDLTQAADHLKQLQETPESPEQAIQILQLEGLLNLERGNSAAGLAQLKQAVEAELELPIDFGPPQIIKPSLELYGEILLRLDRPADALAAFQQQLERTPNRRLTLAGISKAKSGR